MLNMPVRPQTMLTFYPSLTIVLVLVLLASAASTGLAQDKPRLGVELAERDKDTLAVVDMAIGTDIDERQPVGVADHFRADVGKLACWLKIRNDGDPTDITVVWRFDDSEVQRQTVSVGKSRRWRSWTRQRIWGKFSGSWSCEVLTEEGVSLGKAVVRVN
ncbi:MAG: DUF2914 domain-containing protein [Myxococcota bacterium]